MRQVEEGVILFAKVEKESQSIVPSKRDEDAGYDLYASFEEKEVVILPGEIKVIKTGVATAFHPNYVMIVKERGSTGSKCMSVRMGVVDSGYRGEIMVGINNTSDRTIVITKDPLKYEGQAILDGRPVITVYPYSKAIAQAVVVVKPTLQVQEVSFDHLKEFTSERGDSALGASGK